MAWIKEAAVRGKQKADREIEQERRRAQFLIDRKLHPVSREQVSQFIQPVLDILQTFEADLKSEGYKTSRIMRFNIISHERGSLTKLDPNSYSVTETHPDKYSMGENHFALGVVWRAEAGKNNNEERTLGVTIKPMASVDRAEQLAGVEISIWGETLSYPALVNPSRVSAVAEQLSNPGYLEELKSKLLAIFEQTLAQIAEFDQKRILRRAGANQ